MEVYEDLLVAEGEADRGEVCTVDEVEHMMNDHTAKHVAKQPKRAAKSVRHTLMNIRTPKQL